MKIIHILRFYKKKNSKKQQPKNPKQTKNKRVSAMK